jgi:hypothetical protein
MLRIQLAQPDQAKVCQIRRPVSVTYRQLHEARDMIGNKECWPDQPLLHEAQDDAGATQMERSFRQDRVAGQ